MVYRQLHHYRIIQSFKAFLVSLVLVLVFSHAGTDLLFVHSHQASETAEESETRTLDVVAKTKSVFSHSSFARKQRPSTPIRVQISRISQLIPIKLNIKYIAGFTPRLTMGADPARTLVLPLLY